MSRIPRKPVPESRHNSVVAQEPDQARSSEKKDDFGEIGLEDDETSTNLSRQNRSHELAGSQDTSQPSRVNAAEDFSDDDESARDPSLEPPPAYKPSEIDINQEGLHARATAAYDGRVDIKIDSLTRRLSRRLTTTLPSQLVLEEDSPPSEEGTGHLPALNIVIQIVGSRGDVQPFVSLGLTLKKLGHRVRIATHATFRRFIENLGLEFFCIGGDPVELMAFMVKNPGLIPSFDSVRSGEVRKRRKTVRDILHGCWRSCFEGGNGMDVEEAEASRVFGVQREPAAAEERTDPIPFVADAIIANPPSFAHLHCAEKLGIPLHIMFTMPWSSTQAFPHPLANIKSSSEDESLSNALSYVLVEMMTWQGLGDIINRFRRKVLRLEPVDPSWAPGMIARLQIPHTYCWSPSLIPKPRDWGHNINIAGFYFLSLAASYTPSPELDDFLRSGSVPVYIGFGSIVVDDPDALTRAVYEATQLAGVRALVATGWGSLGGATPVPPNIFLLSSCPHDWLFERVSCVVHHGGAGTTAAGIAAGKPTVIVPFFGDQPFWGSMIARAGAGPQPIPFKALTASNLAAAITTALQPKIVEDAKALGQKISNEQGADVGARYFHDRLPLGIMGCSVVPRRAAAWKVRKIEMKLSALAASVLMKEGFLDFEDLKLFRPCEYDLNHGPWDPLTGGTIALVDLFYDVFKGIGEIGSEFVRVPSVSQSETSKTNQAVHYPARSEVSLNTKDKIVGARAAKGIARMTKATVRSPMIMTVAMAQGAHNLPKMYGDKTVRPQDKITGVGSGLMAGTKELALQTYDGVTGLFTQPIMGAREEGAIGAAKGLGRGFLGAVIKPFAGMSSIVGYPLKGIDVAITKGASEKILSPVIYARVAQGELEYQEASEEEKREIVDRWVALAGAKKTSRKDKGKGKGKENKEEQAGMDK